MKPKVSQPARKTKRAKPLEGYVVAFFMRPEVGKQEPIILSHVIRETLSTTPQMARLKWCDNVHQGQREWKKYQRAGHRIRKIRITDLGDA
jgi:hypothetical protein